MQRQKTLLLSRIVVLLCTLTFLLEYVWFKLTKPIIITVPTEAGLGIKWCIQSKTFMQLIISKDKQFVSCIWMEDSAIELVRNWITCSFYRIALPLEQMEEMRRVLFQVWNPYRNAIILRKEWRIEGGAENNINSNIMCFDCIFKMKWLKIE